MKLILFPNSRWTIEALHSRRSILGRQGHYSNPCPPANPANPMVDTCYNRHMTPKERYLQLRVKFDEARANGDLAMASIIRAELAKVWKTIPLSDRGDLDTCPEIALDSLGPEFNDPT